MGNLWVRINYSVVSAILQSMKANIVLLEKCLDQAATQEGDSKPIICTRADCPNRTEDA